MDADQLEALAQADAEKEALEQEKIERQKKRLSSPSPYTDEPKIEVTE